MTAPVPSSIAASSTARGLERGPAAARLHQQTTPASCSRPRRSRPQPRRARRRRRRAACAAGACSITDLQHACPARDELRRPVPARGVARGGAHPRDELRRAQQLDHAPGERRRVAARHEEPVDAVGDLLARSVLDVVAHHRAAAAHALQRRQRIALERLVMRNALAVHSASRGLAGRSRAGSRARASPRRSISACELLAPAPRRRRCRAARPARPRPPARTPAIACLRRFCGSSRATIATRSRVARRQAGRRAGRVDRVGDDVHVARPAAPLRDVVALALGQRDHRVQAADAARSRGGRRWSSSESQRNGGCRWTLCIR